VGDSPDDILSAKPISIFTVGVVSGLAKQDRLLEAGADRIIHNLSELPSVVKTGKSS
jgi:phosphoglycolate phosphatase-like HAD superfamily hydrolase